MPRSLSIGPKADSYGMRQLLRFAGLETHSFSSVAAYFRKSTEHSC